MNLFILPCHLICLKPDFVQRCRLQLDVPHLPCKSRWFKFNFMLIYSLTFDMFLFTCHSGSFKINLAITFSLKLDVLGLSYHCCFVKFNFVHACSFRLDVWHLLQFYMCKTNFFILLEFLTGDSNHLSCQFSCVGRNFGNTSSFILDAFLFPCFSSCVNIKFVHICSLRLYAMTLKETCYISHVTLGVLNSISGLPLV